MVVQNVNDRDNLRWSENMKFIKEEIIEVTWYMIDKLSLILVAPVVVATHQMKEVWIAQNVAVRLQPGKDH